MGLPDFDKDGQDAAKALVDEAAIKLVPAIDYLVSELKKLFVGKKITIKIEDDNPAS